MRIRETGLSDFIYLVSLIVSVMKTTFTKLKPRVIHYRDYKMFCNDESRQSLLAELSVKNIDINCYGIGNFFQLCINALDNFTPHKKK